jgi:multidrug efflux pump subunit AcrA (membrane-fusion protein)
MQKSQAALKLSQARYDVRAARGGVESSPEALDLESKTLDFEVAQANYERAVAKAGQTAALTAVDIEIQKQQIALAQLDLERQNKVIDPQLQKNVERSQLAVDRLKAKLDATRILAPIPGKVTSVSAYDGRAIEAYKVAVIVADEAKLEITAEPLSSQMQKLTENMATAIALSSYPGKELVGKITKLPYPYGTGGSATQSTTEQDKLTHISFDAKDLKVEPGDLVKVIVTLQQKQDALWLPPAALRTFAGRKFVVVEEEGRQRRVDVTTGIESAERVEILDGLKENQVVVGQ